MNSTKGLGKWPREGSLVGNATKATVRIVKASVRGKKVRVSEEVKSARLAICEVCPNFYAKSRRCKLCGCYLSNAVGKVSWSTESCPDSPPRWGPVDVE